MQLSTVFIIFVFLAVTVIIIRSARKERRAQKQGNLASPSFRTGWEKTPVTPTPRYSPAPRRTSDISRRDRTVERDDGMSAALYATNYDSYSSNHHRSSGHDSGSSSSGWGGSCSGSSSSSSSDSGSSGSDGGGGGGCD